MGLCALRKLGIKAGALAAAALSLCFVASFAQSAKPANAATIEGTVRNSAGVPIAGASVILEQKRRATAQTKTNADGSFAFPNLSPGDYAVVAEKAGLHTPALTTTLAAGVRRHLDLLLESAAPGNSPASHASTISLHDEPNFTIAGITDGSGAGGHGSDTALRTSEALARETLALKSGGSASADSANGDLAQARQQAQMLLARGESADAHHLLGDLNERLGDSLAAVREYERAAQLEPSERNYFDWGTELLLHRAVQPAIEVFTKGASAHPKSARMLAGLGAALYAGGSHDEAARRLCQAADLQPQDPAPYIFLGKMEKAATAPLHCAQEKLGRFAGEQPANALANLYYAISLWKEARGTQNPSASQRVLALLEKSVALDPKLDEAYLQLGIVHYARGDLRQAIAAGEKALAANPHCADAHYWLGRSYKQVGEAAKAQHEFEKFEQLKKAEAAAAERQRRELRQFLVVLKDQPGEAPQ
jgi:tetratricopeptide (TPR) repeat protein